MSKSGLHRHYGKLTAEERFRLDVLATARGDLQESQRLVSSCPRFLLHHERARLRRSVGRGA